VPDDAVRRWSAEELFRGALPPTEDDVPVTADGRRLDTAAKVVAFLEEIDRKRRCADRGGGPLGVPPPARDHDSPASRSTAEDSPR